MRNRRLLQTTEIVGYVNASTPGKQYEIRKGADGKIYCTCPAWGFGAATHKPCKHLIGMITGSVKVHPAAQPRFVHVPRPATEPLEPMRGPARTTASEVEAINRALLQGTLGLTQSGLVTGDDDVL